MKNTVLLCVTAAALFLLMTSCSMKQDIYIESSGAGRVSVEVQLADYLTAVVDQVQNVSGTKAIANNEENHEGSPFFNVKAISEDFSNHEGVVLESIETPDPNSLTGSFRFDDINSLYQQMDSESAESRLIELTRNNGLNELSVSITKETVLAIIEENQSMNNPLVENFGPGANEGLSEEDYLSMMEFALGTESRQGIIDSNLLLTVHVEGGIIDQQGGTLVDAKTVTYEVPLLPVLLLNENLEYSLRYR